MSSDCSSYWKNYWEELKDGGHHYQEEHFLEIEAREKLFHLDGGEILLDFGCGSADLLIFFAPHYKEIVGSDFSTSMLNEAKVRLNAGKCNNVSLILADEKNIWQLANRKFDRITCAGVVQYFTISQLDTFIKGATANLQPGGKIILFDVIDPLLYTLRQLGLLKGGRINFPALSRQIISFLAGKLRRALKGHPGTRLGYAHHFSEIAGIAAREGLKSELVSSMYYRYRYHAVLTHI